jgi:hypothetical protein
MSGPLIPDVTRENERDRRVAKAEAGQRQLLVINVIAGISRGEILDRAEAERLPSPRSEAHLWQLDPGHIRLGEQRAPADAGEHG